MLNPKASPHTLIIHFLSIFFLALLSLTTLAGDNNFKIMYKPTEGEAKLIHSGKISTESDDAGISTVSYSPIPEATPPTITITPSPELPNYGTVTIDDHSVPNILLLDQLFSASYSLTDLEHQISNSDFLWINMPFFPPHEQSTLPENAIEPVFQVGDVINNNGQLTIHATPLGCTNCSCDCATNDKSGASYCANCKCCGDKEDQEVQEVQEGKEVQENKEGYVKATCACINCGCSNCQRAPDDSDVSTTATCSDCPCCKISETKKCKGKERGKIIIRLSENNDHISDVSLQTPEGVTTIFLHGVQTPETETEPETVTATETSALAEIAVLFGALAITGQASAAKP